MGSNVVDQPDHLAKVLAELEARKQSLRSRLESLDTAINGLHGLQAASSASDSSELEGLRKAEEILAGAEQLVQVPLREQMAEVMPPLAVKTQSEPQVSERRDFVLKYDSPNSPAQTPKALKRPLQSSS